MPTNNDEGYTGVFKGAQHMIIRLSEAGFVFDNTEFANPSIALKFLRDGVPSANTFGMVNFIGTQSPDFFASDFTSHVPKHESECLNQSITKWNSQATRNIYQNASMTLANHDENGVAEEDIQFPYFLRFRPA